jgi:hypothetical protein
MIGLDPAKDLLHNYSPTMDSFWFHFVQHVNGVMRKYGYLLRKLKCQDILEMDDSLLVVVQLRGGDKSESHSVCIYGRSIFNSASRFVLVKSRGSRSQLLDSESRPLGLQADPPSQAPQYHC